MKVRLRPLVIALVSCMAAHAWAASPWAVPAADLGARIAALTGPGTASLSIKNSSPIPHDQVVGIRRAIEAQLKSTGVQLREAEAASEVRVTLSENVRGYLWIAEVQQGSETRVAMLEIPRTDARPTAVSTTALIVRRSPLVSQAEPILDAITVPGPRLVVLGSSSIDLYDQVAGRWQSTQSFPVSHTAPFPRDVRGRIVASADHVFDAYLPGTVCSASQKVATVECHSSDDPWPLGVQSAFFNSARNFFSGLLKPGFTKQMPSFYSVATLPRANYTLWVFAGTDNVVRTWDGVNLRPVGNTRDWGSDIASIRSGCGAGNQLLVTSAGDDSSGDAIRVFEVTDREPVLVASPLTVEGPVVALWPAPDQASAVAVVHNQQQGTYDAYSVSISCSQ